MQNSQPQGNDNPKRPMDKQSIIRVKGMHCRSCEMLIRDALEEAGARVSKISVDEKKQEGAVIASGMTEAKIRSIIKKEGYTPL